MFRVVQGEIERRQRVRASQGGSTSGDASTTNSDRIERRTFVRIDDEEPGEGDRSVSRQERRRQERERRRNRDRDDAAAEPEEIRQCRICLSDETSDDNPLFSPCLCRGTSLYVHRECLNNWRRLSTNTNSFWRCDSCRYVYRIQKLQHLDILKHPLFLSVASLLFLLGASLLAAIFYGSFLPSFFRDKVTSTCYQYIRFAPPWRRQLALSPSWQSQGLLSSLLDALFMSVFTIGLLGFAWVMYRRYRMHRGEEFMRIVTPSLLLSSMQVGTAFLRLCAVAGLFAIWTKLYETVYQQTSKWVMDHGELVLDISQTGGRRDERSSSGSDSMEEVQQARMSRTQARILSFALWLNEFTRQPDPNPNQNPQQAPR